ncbi:MAG: hypothetical protein QXY92_02410 [Archaeoglobaceae archaeon]
MKLTPKIVIIVLLASFVPLLLLAQLTVMGVAEFGENARTGVINVSQVYIVKAGEEAVKMKTDELSKKLELYLRSKLRENPNLTTTDLLKDPDFWRSLLEDGEWVNTLGLWVRDSLGASGE